MVSAILADVLSLHKTHIGSEREGVRESCAGPGPTNLGIADEAVEIGDLRGIVDIGQRCPWCEWIMVDQDAKRFGATGDRVRQDGIVVVAAPGRSG